MKKIIFIFFSLLFLFLLFFLFPKEEKLSNYTKIKESFVDYRKLDFFEEELIQSEGLVEEITPKWDENGFITSFDIEITIPLEYSSDTIIISPKLFEGINHYKSIKSGDMIDIHFIIHNKSSYHYKYRDDSLVVSTKDFSSFPYMDTGGVGFDGVSICELFIPFRTFNNALKVLYGDGFYTLEDLSDEILEQKLIEHGYSSLSSLTQYYLDYFNQTYGLNQETLYDFDYSIIKEIFDGDVSNQLETIPSMVEVAYDYFYHQLFFLSFYDFSSLSYSDELSIGSYMEENWEDSYLKNNFYRVTHEKSYELNMRLGIHSLFFTNAFNRYPYAGYFRFILEKEI